MLESIVSNVIAGAVLLAFEAVVKAMFKKYQATKEYQKLTYCVALILLAASVSLVLAVLCSDNLVLLLLFLVPFVFGIVAILMVFRAFVRIALDAVSVAADLCAELGAEESGQHDEQTVR